MADTHSLKILILIMMTFSLLGAIIGYVYGSNSILNFCFNKGVAFLELEGYELGVHPNAIELLIKNKLLSQPERLDTLTKEEQKQKCNCYSIQYYKGNDYLPNYCAAYFQEPLKNGECFL